MDITEMGMPVVNMDAIREKNLSVYRRIAILLSHFRIIIGSSNKLQEMNRMKKNFTLDTILLILGLVCLVTGVVLDFQIVPRHTEARHLYRDIHTYIGYAMYVGLVIHIAWHKAWIQTAARKLLKR